MKGSLAPFEEICSTALWSLGQLNLKKDFMDVFIAGLDDPSPKVVLTPLQALEGGARSLPASGLCTCRRTIQDGGAPRSGQSQAPVEGNGAKARGVRGDSGFLLTREHLMNDVEFYPVPPLSLSSPAAIFASGCRVAVLRVGNRQP